jgi:hypothetical protein
VATREPWATRRQPCLRPELAQDVLDAREVRLRFDELLLSAPPTSLVAGVIVALACGGDPPGPTPSREA